MDSQEEVILDLNELAKEHDYLKLGVFSISPDENTLAYSMDVDGSEKYKLFFKDLSTGKPIEPALENTYEDFAWANDNKTVYFNELNDKLRPDRVYRYSLGQAADSKTLVYKEESPEFFVRLDKSRSQNYIFIKCEGSITTESHYLDANDVQSEPKLITP